MAATETDPPKANGAGGAGKEILRGTSTPVCAWLLGGVSNGASAALARYTSST